VIQGDSDEIVPEPAVRKLVEKLSNQRDIQIDYRVIAGANHFFVDQIETLAGNVEDYIRAAGASVDPEQSAS
jgi:alpha/beta superfamily hydrolase